ncbi:NAD(P)-dependent oxidoreductase [Nocardioides iriomotensis]|uniref:NAD(P)-dependent oxidoreductase n=1 Tax=Nocardioides iriomotensis TaxID=715784 RepID=A0A4Q5J7G7_9ACTN|nr:NAD(P)-dependent oxidoreductase [Nocardioides iriomotensis]RYU13729.1 NAD(P)-dependent oxidoreductase [Nocardioides iriomotensis]
MSSPPPATRPVGALPGRTLFVGLGRMGAPMVRRYAATRPTVVHDADAATTQRVAAASGATPLPSLDALPDLDGSPIDVVVLVLPTSTIVEQVLLADGVLDTLAPGALVVDIGSSVPASTRRLAALAAQRGIGYVDAPVSGGVARAETGELAIMVGGEPDHVRAARPHLEPLGTTIVPVGPAGSGHAAKALNNLLSATQLAAAAEVLSVAQRAGIEPAVMLDVLNSSTGRSQATEVKYPRHVLTGTFASGFELELMVKDLSIAADLADQLGSTIPVTSAAVELARSARAHLAATGTERPDHTALVTYVEHVNTTSLRATTTDPAPAHDERTPR